MTQFKDLPPEAKEGFRLLLTTGVDAIRKDYAEVTSQTYKLLFLSNGAGIALLASFLGVMVGREQGVRHFLVPLSLFLVGIILSGGLYVRLAIFLEHATFHGSNQAFHILVNQMEIQDLKPWIWTKRGVIINRVLAFSSFACFVLAVTLCIYFLRSM